MPKTAFSASGERTTYERIADILHAHDPDFSDAITMRIDSAIPV